MIIFLFKPNMNTLMLVSKNYIEIFYRIVVEDIFESVSTKANMDWVFKLMQYFMLCDMPMSIKSILKYHIPFYLIGNIEVSSARHTLNSLLVPGDRYFKIPQTFLATLYKYLKKTNFWSFFMDCFVDYNQIVIANKMGQLKEKFPAETFSYSMFEEYTAGGQKNPF